MEPHENNRRIDADQMDSEVDELELPSCLIVANVPDSVFESTQEDRDSFQQMFTNFGSAGFVYLKSFRRVLINYDSAISAALAKLTLHFTDFKERELKVFFKKVR